MKNDFNKHTLTCEHILNTYGWVTWVAASCYIHLCSNVYFLLPFCWFFYLYIRIGCCCCLFAIRFGFLFHFPRLLCTQRVAATGETNANLCMCILNVSPQLKRLFSPLNLNSALKMLGTRMHSPTNNEQSLLLIERALVLGVIGNGKKKNE